MEVRKIYTFVDEAHQERGKLADTPLRKAAAVVVVKNPYAGKVQEDLSELVEASKEIGSLVTEKAVKVMGDFPIESYGKAALIGVDGEQEHGVAMLTTVFGNILRDAVGGGKAWISSMTKRSEAGASIDIPLAYKDALYVRSHYDGMSITLHDAPLPDEIAVICAVANRGRLNARVGGLTVGEVKGEDGLR